MGTFKKNFAIHSFRYFGRRTVDGGRRIVQCGWMPGSLDQALGGWMSRRWPDIRMHIWPRKGAGRLLLFFCGLSIS